MASENINYKINILDKLLDVNSKYQQKYIEHYNKWIQVNQPEDYKDCRNSRIDQLSERMVV